MSEATGPRVPPLPQGEWTDAARDVFGFYEGEEARRNGSASNFMMTLANHPPLAMVFLRWGDQLLTKSTLDKRSRELLTLRIGHLTKCEYEWVNHVLPGKMAGLTDEEIEAIKIGPSDPIWTGRDKAILDAVDQLISHHRVEDATWAELAKAFDRTQLVELIFTMGHYLMNAWVLSALGVEVEPHYQATLDKWLADRAAGKLAET